MKQWDYQQAEELGNAQRELGRCKQQLEAIQRACWDAEEARMNQEETYQNIKDPLCDTTAKISTETILQICGVSHSPEAMEHMHQINEKRKSDTEAKT